MNKDILLLILITLIISNCNNYSQISISDLNFNNSIFADNKKDNLHTFCLLASGYFRSPHSNNADSLVSQWLINHPNAKVISVASHGPTLEKYPDSKMTFCWLIDKTDTINNYLIKNGCYPGGTMTLSTLKGLTDIETLHVSKESYDNFVRQIIAAEEYAIQKKKGIWSKENNEE